MLLGIDNEFVLKNAFDEADIFTGALIDNIIYYPLDGRMVLDIQIKNRVLNQPKRWGEYDYISLTIEFFGVKETHIKDTCKLFRIYKLDINRQDELFFAKIIDADSTEINLLFTVARVQRIIPMKYNQDLDKFEIAVSDL